MVRAGLWVGSVIRVGLGLQIRESGGRAASGKAELGAGIYPAFLSRGGWSGGSGEWGRWRVDGGRDVGAIGRARRCWEVGRDGFEEARDGRALVDEGLCAGVAGDEAVVGAVVGGEHDDGGGGDADIEVGADGGEDGRAVHAGHHPVDQAEVGGSGAEVGQEGGAGRKGGGVVAAEAEKRDQQVADVGVVIGDEDSGHRACPFVRGIGTYGDHGRAAAWARRVEIPFKELAADTGVGTRALAGVARRERAPSVRPLTAPNGARGEGFATRACFYLLGVSL